MSTAKYLTKTLMTMALCGLATQAFAKQIDIPAGDLGTALDAYVAQTGVHIFYAARDLHGARTKGVKGDFLANAALSQILSGTGFVTHLDSGVVEIVRKSDLGKESVEDMTQARLAATAISTSSGAALETVTVTSSKIGGDVQNIPISITALSQEQLTATQTAGGPDLVKQVPNMSFTKTNFTGYSIQLRGIGTQAISVTTDPAVAVAFNDIPFIRNHFFEQEFYDVSQVEVLRGPQGTLYGRNATAGVVNLISAKPSDQFEAMASIDVGNYGERRPEGMINIPIVDDRLDIRIAGEWTKRQGYSFNTITDSRTDGRDLWSGRVSIGWKPFEKVQTNLVWEHFSESDDRMRTSKQLCKTAPLPASVDGVPVPPIGTDIGFGGAFDPASYLSQSCELSSLYSPEAFGVPEGFALSYLKASKLTGEINPTLDPYAETTQSPNLRVIETTVNPGYKAKNDVVEFNADYAVTPALTITSQTGFNHDFLWSNEDYNRFDTAPGIFIYTAPDFQNNKHDQVTPDPAAGTNGVPLDSGVFCDPQVGCADRVVAQDLSDEHAWQLSQEFRLSSNFSGPFNFSVGGNYLHYETEENYYVFINTLTLYSLGSFGGGAESVPWVPGVSDNHQCLYSDGLDFQPPTIDRESNSGPSQNQCNYIDPNPIPKLNNEGHNYFLSQNPYALNSYAGFGEAYYSVLSDLKLTAGLRWTEDRKHFVDIPSELITDGWGYATSGVVNQQWDQFTGRAAANWTPKLDFTDQTLIYASYAHGYKAGGANPPGAILIGNAAGNNNIPVHPLTFKPEFIDAFELGSKNTLLDGSLTLNADMFYYNYENYQISEIVDRTAINNNYDAHVKGAEIETTWEPVPGLRLNFAGGWEDTSVAKGASGIDLMDRTAINPDWMVVKPYPTQSSNCILPKYVVAAILMESNGLTPTANPTQADVFLAEACGVAYSEGHDPLTYLPYVPNPTVSCSSFDCHGSVDGSMNQPPPPGYAGFDPVSPTATNNGAGPAPNIGEGFSKGLSGHKLPNAPPFTVSFGTQYTMPLSPDWAGTLRGDYYWQDYSWARVFNDNPYDRLRGYTNVNLTLIFTNQNGWQVMLYDKNVFNTAAITGDFLNSDDSGLTTNVFLTDPKLIGVRVTKNW